MELPLQEIADSPSSLRMNQPARRFWLKLALFLFFTAISAVGLATVQALKGPTEPTVEYMQDNGFVLDVSQMLSRGRVLYQDVFWPYGPIPIGLYHLTAAVLGNSPDTYLTFEYIWSVPVTFLIYILVRRRFPLTYTLLFLALLARVCSPISRQIVYEKFELIFLLLAALSWVPLEKRTTLHCLGLGGLIAAMQFTKFGTHVVLAGALLFLDFLLVAQYRFSPACLRLALRKNLVTYGAYLLLLAATALVMGLYLDHSVLRDVLWPSFIQNSYSYVVDGNRYPRLFNPGFFIGVELPWIVGLGACLFAMACVLRRAFCVPRDLPEDSSFPYELMIAPLFFAIAIPLIFRHVFHYYQYSILAVLGIPLLYELLGKKFRPLLILFFIPYALWIPVTLIKDHHRARQSPPFVHLPMPDGVVLVGTIADVQFYQSFITELRRKAGTAASGPTGVTSLILNPGMYYFSGLSVAGRHAWYLPNWVRPWEEPKLAADLAQASAMAVSLSSPPAGLPSSTDLAQALDDLPEKIRQPLIARLIDPVCVGTDPWYHHSVWIYSVRKN